MQSLDEKRTIIQRAIDSKSAVWFEYTNRQGATNRHQVWPQELGNDEEFYAEARNGKLLTFRFNRINGDIALIAPPSTEPGQREFASATEGFQVAKSAIRARDVPQKLVKPPSHTQNPRFERVSNRVQWRNLLQYYVDCLEHESRQDFILQNTEDSHIVLPIGPETLMSFLAQTQSVSLEIVTQGDFLHPIARFVQDIPSRNQTLCVGYPVLSLMESDERGKEKFFLAPLFFAPLSIHEGDGELTLISEGNGISYAALTKLNLDESDYEIIQELSKKAGRTETSLLQTETQLIEIIEDLIGEPLPRFEGEKLTLLPRPNVLYETPILFWVTSAFTDKLMDELKTLSALHWDSLPPIIKSFFGEIQPALYPAAQTLPQDEHIYVTPVNDHQRHAVNAASQCPLVVVTGPPGTGKSQMVLNVIADSVLNHKSVLLASKNNKAVDVVVERLHNEIEFEGMVRTGKWSLWSDAGRFMKNALSHAASSDANDRQITQDIHSYRLTRDSLWNITHHLLSLKTTSEHILDRASQFDQQFSQLAPTLHPQVQEVSHQFSGHQLKVLEEEIGEMFLQARQLKDGKITWRFKLEAIFRLTTPFRLIRKRYYRFMSELALDSACDPNDSSNLYTCSRQLYSFVRCCRLFQLIGQMLNDQVERLNRINDAEASAFAYTPPDKHHEVSESIQILRGDWEKLRADWQDALSGLQLRRQILDLAPVDPLVDTINARINALNTDRGAKILWDSWSNSVKNLPSATIQATNEYATALEILGNYETDSGGYSQAKSTQHSHFEYALKVFPAWTTTNLSVKTSLPLEPEIFDLLVIDEASQCDIASAIPLFYRAKRAVIIGDDKQLEHIVKLPDNVEDSFAQEHGVPRTLSFKHSLFEVSQLATSNRHILLKEHYRSHRDIIAFSNRAFYNGELVIKTDMRARGLPETYLENGCGVFWLNVNGVAERPRSGSAFNQQELERSRELVNELHNVLHMLAWQNASIGFVTPFRKQRKLFEAKVMNSEVTVGTAHTFQGDECDIVILSPVLADGLPARTLAWLKSKGNLLNVAVTRARCTVIVVGDFTFCKQQDRNNPYRQLADYYEELGRPVYRGLDELPFLLSSSRQRQ